VVLRATVSPLSDFSLISTQGRPWLVYVARDTRALVLAAPQSASAPAYLDRITDLPEQEPLSGAHLAFAAGEDLHLLYLDRQSEDSLLLKHVRRSSGAQTAWLELPPGSGRPLAAFLREPGMEVFFERDGGLYREGAREGPAVLVRAPFRSQGRACRFAAGGLEGFTVFDEVTHRLLLFLLRGAQVLDVEVARFGQVQDSGVDPAGRLEILAYDPRSFRILLYRSQDPTAGFEVQPVTLSRGTTSLSLLHLPAGPAFLFNELSPRDRSSHQLALLAFSPQSGYRKTVLHRSQQPIAAVRGLAGQTALFAALLEEELLVLRVDYGSLRQPARERR